MEHEEFVDEERQLIRHVAIEQGRTCKFNFHQWPTLTNHAFRKEVFVWIICTADRQIQMKTC